MKEPLGNFIPSDEFNGMTIAFTQTNYTDLEEGIFIDIAGENERRLDAVGPRRSIDLVAPGRNILVPPLDGDYEKDTGASFATPHITGAVALLAQYAKERIAANAARWDGVAYGHLVMKAVLMNSADKVKDSGDGLRLGMEKTIKWGKETWDDSDARDEASNPGGMAIPLHEAMGTGQLNVSRAVKQFSSGEYTAEDSTIPVVGWNYSLAPFSDETEEVPFTINGTLKKDSYISITLAWDRVVTLDDSNADGKYDSGETLTASNLADLDVELEKKDGEGNYSVVASSTSRDDSVEHLFFKLPDDGEYRIRVKRISADDNGLNTPFALAWWAVPKPDESKTGSIGDFVWTDLDRDGSKDSGEPGIPGVLVDLYKSDGSFITSAYTQSDGSYVFPHVAEGDYFVRFNSPDGYEFTTQYAGSDDSLDSDANDGGYTDVFSVGTSAVQTIDAGLVYTAPVVYGLSASAGPLGGTNQVTIYGAGFTDATAVHFGSTAATSFTVVSHTEILATVPSASAGAIDVTITTGLGTSPTGYDSEYTYVAAPTISSLSTSTDTASGGIPVTITGTNLAATTAVRFGSTDATAWTVNSNTSLTVTVPAHTTGTIDVTVLSPGGESGTLSFTYTASSTVTWVGGSTGSWSTGSNWSGGVVPTSSDDVVIGAGKTVTYSSGTSTVHSLSVAGGLDVTGGTLNVSALSSVYDLSLSGFSSPTLGGLGEVTVSHSFTWSGGTLADAGTLVIDSGATASLSGFSLSLGSGRTVVNHGIVSMSGSSLSFASGAQWVNEYDGEFDASAGMMAGISGSVVFVNRGTFVKTGSGTLGFGGTFVNEGMLDVQAGTFAGTGGSSSGTLNVASSASFTLTGTFDFSSDSTVSGSGSLLFASGSAVTLAGSVTASSVTFDSGSSVTVAAGTTISANVTNNGSMTVASGPGTVTVDGNFSQGFGGTLIVQIGGTTAGTNYDQLNVSGSATLAGTLSASYVGGFTPSTGNTFELLTFGSRSGTFGSISGTASGLTPLYDDDDFTLIV